MNDVEIINERINSLENQLKLNYGRITPIDRENININILNLKIQKQNIILNELRYRQSPDPIDRIEFEKQQILLRFYNLSREQAQLRINKYR